MDLDSLLAAGMARERRLGALRAAAASHLRARSVTARPKPKATCMYMGAVEAVRPSPMYRAALLHRAPQAVPYCPGAISQQLAVPLLTPHGRAPRLSVSPTSPIPQLFLHIVSPHPLSHL
jgi:hypothetical protein